MTMRIAVAGSGDLARYVCAEFVKAKHQVVILTRNHKDHFNVPGVTQHVTDYTLESLRQPLQNCQVLISTISDVSPLYIDVHRTLIRACQQSTSCKRFIPSEFAGDVRAYPDQPGFYYSTREPVRRILREQTGLEWTLMCIGWMADYLVPSSNRYIKDIGHHHPLDISNGKMVIPGTGDESVDFTWARDVARALVALVDAPMWEPYTYVSGQRSSWNEVAQLITQRYYPRLKVKHISLYHITQLISSAKDEDELFTADHWLFSVSQGSSVPGDKVQAHRQKYFGNMLFRNLDDGFTELDENPKVVL